MISGASSTEQRSAARATGAVRQSPPVRLFTVRLLMVFLITVGTTSATSPTPGAATAISKPPDFTAPSSAALATMRRVPQDAPGPLIGASPNSATPHRVSRISAGSRKPGIPDAIPDPAPPAEPHMPAKLDDLAPPEMAESRWALPVDGPLRVLRGFAPPAQPWLPGHRGVDLAARPGQVVRAAGPGTVGYAGPLAGRGVIMIIHPGGLRTTYLPVHASVRRGQTVSRGDVIGSVEETTGHCDASCLHWGLIKENHYLDALLLIGLGQVRLLPRWP
ncbi:MAG: peptidase family [Sphaerisporangium sp.]|nr:peptidase family [Sphaerisporangium sp.]